MSELRDLDVLIVDCQTTGATPSHGRMLELGWRRYRACQPVVTDRESAETARLIAGPANEGPLPERITSVTGISESMLDDAPTAETVWRQFRNAADDAGDWPVECLAGHLHENFSLDVLEAGVRDFSEAHDLDAPEAESLARLGLRLWLEKQAEAPNHQEDGRDEDEASSEPTVPERLESVLRRATARLRLGLWLERLSGAALAWQPAHWRNGIGEDADNAAGWRFLAFDGPGLDTFETLADRSTARRRVTESEGSQRPVATLEDYDRLRVLTTELRRLCADGVPVWLVTGEGTLMDRSILADCLRFV